MESNFVRPSFEDGRSACVLLSTYNGATYLRAQLDSILAQVGCQVTVCVRDDGSSDATRDLLRDYMQRDGRLRVTFGENIGAAASFFWLIRHVAVDADAYFFSDQDDLWDENKCSAAIEALRAVEAGRPGLYCSRVRYIDRSDRIKGLSPIPSCISFGNALAECVSVGCSMALNHASVEAVGTCIPDKNVTMHDWWCYLVLAAADAAVIYDPVPRIGYRQHGGNLIGASPSVLATRFVRLRRRLSRTAGAVTRSRQAGELLEIAGTKLSEENRDLLETFVRGKRSLKSRLALLASRKVRRGTWLDQLLLDLQILFNDY